MRNLTCRLATRAEESNTRRCLISPMINSVHVLDLLSSSMPLLGLLAGRRLAAALGVVRPRQRRQAYSKRVLTLATLISNPQPLEPL